VNKRERELPKNCAFSTNGTPTPSFGTRGSQVQIRHSDQYLADPQDSSTVSPTDIAASAFFVRREAGRMAAPCFAHLLTITAWLEVRVLPTAAQTEISRFSANSPELAAIRHAFCLCALPIELQGPFRRSLSLPWKIAFPDGGDWRW
jgi:hypothetical protein